MLLVLNKTIKELSAGINITKIQQGGYYNTNNPSTTNGSNFETGDSTNTIALEEGQTLGTFMNKINNESS